MSKLITPSGRVGKALPSPFLMPLHTLLRLEDGTTRWVLSEILKPAPLEIKPKSTKSKRKRTRKKAPMSENPSTYTAKLSQSLIAIDPGLKGGIAFQKQQATTAKPLPTAGKDLDLVTLAAWIEAAQPQLAIIEKVGAMPKQGVSSTFKFGSGYGGLLGICAALQIPVELVTPQRWKRVVLAGTQKDKDAAIAYCRRAFPEVELIQPGSRKPHDGVADALCLLQFGIREFLNSESQEKAA